MSSSRFVIQLRLEDGAKFRSNVVSLGARQEASHRNDVTVD
jgi:hypothetical protein